MMVRFAQRAPDPFFALMCLVTRVMTVKAEVGRALPPDMIKRGALPTRFRLSGIKDS